MRRPLWETLTNVLEALGSGDANELVRVTGVSLDLPLEVQLRRARGGPELRADLPQWRWETVFDPPLSRLRLRAGDPLVQDPEVP